jgi:selenide,water dikinase
MIQTVDFFPPVVDDPFTFGAIAAANAMSDVYAMGGEVLLALNIAGFPDDLPLNLVAEIFRGGAEKVAEAGGIVVGGHTIYDQEPKYGLCVLGLAHPDHILTKGGAQAGDRLYLTKPLGTGIILTAAKENRADPQHVEAAVESMLRLNRHASHLVREVGVHALTDVTGFAIVGHSLEVSERSGVAVHLSLERLPTLPGAVEYAREGIQTGGAGRNRAALASLVTVPSGIPDELEALLFDPQTSGGLLIAVGRDRAEALEGRFRAAGEPLWLIGEVRAGSGVVVE